jgi:hypothetical protein
MPFKSQAQRGFMYAKHPEIAKRWEKETEHDHKLPEHVGEKEDGIQKIAKERLAKMKKKA